MNGWLVYHVQQNCQAPHARVLEPLETASESIASKNDADKHVSMLQRKGHETAHLWCFDDAYYIFGEGPGANGIFHAHNDKARLVAEFKSKAEGRYWGNGKNPMNPDFLLQLIVL